MLRSRKPNRMKGKDYSEDGCYFVTSNCKDNKHHFGKVVNGEMVLNEFGEIAKQQILWLQEQYPYLKIHNWVVMPNHVHFLMEIDRGRIGIGTGRDLSVPNRALNQSHSESPNQSNSESLENSIEIFEKNEIPPIKIKSISSLLGAFKTTSSKQIHLAGNEDFAWHRSFHDNIVRNSEAFRNIDRYITNNPKKWDEDKFNGKS
jgi:putative transposase